jgi:hypothetical protein
VLITFVLILTEYFNKNQKNSVIYLNAYCIYFKNEYNKIMEQMILKITNVINYITTKAGGIYYE